MTHAIDAPQRSIELLDEFVGEVVLSGTVRRTREVTIAHSIPIQSIHSLPGKSESLPRGFRKI